MELDAQPDAEPDWTLDAELRRLFCDDRLDIAVRPGADRVIVAGARRVRRRRYLAVTAGAVAVVLLVGGGIAVAANGSWKSLPPAETSTGTATIQEAMTSTSTTTTTTTPPPARPPAGNTQVETVTEGPRGDDEQVDPPAEDPPPSLTDGVLTATGYGPFELGMSLADALATGLLRLDADGGGCLRYSINGGGRVLISDQLGVTRVDVPVGVRTPEGIGANSIVGEVGLAYPWAVEYRLGLTAGTTGEGAASTYQFVTVESPPTTGPIPAEYVIGEVRLALAANDCALAF